MPGRDCQPLLRLNKRYDCPENRARVGQILEDMTNDTASAYRAQVAAVGFDRVLDLCLHGTIRNRYAKKRSQRGPGEEARNAQKKRRGQRLLAKKKMRRDELADERNEDIAAEYGPMRSAIAKAASEEDIEDEDLLL